MNFLDGLAETTNRAFCVILANTVNQADLLQYVLTPGFGEQYNPFPSLYAQNCPLTPPQPPESPFAGGQCATSYRVFWSGEYRGGAPGSANDGYLPVSESTASGVLGPITGIRYIPNPAGNGARVVIDANGVYEGRFGFTTTNSEPFFRNLRITSVVRDDGLPDNCGDPPPDTSPPPPGYNIYNDNVTYNDTNNVEVTIPVILTFGYATVNIDGRLSIPINANFTANPEFNLNFNYRPGDNNVQPDFTDPRVPLPSPCNPPGGFIPDPSVPPPPDSIPDPDPDAPATDDPTERRELLVGCIVTTTFLDGNETTIAQQENPDIYIPATGYVQFRIRVGNVSGWTNDIPVKSLRAFIPCPWDGGAIEVKGTPRFGNQFTVTPVYVTQTFNPTYPPPA